MYRKQDRMCYADCSVKSVYLGRQRDGCYRQVPSLMSGSVPSGRGFPRMPVLPYLVSGQYKSYTYGKLTIDQI